METQKSRNHPFFFGYTLYPTRTLHLARGRGERPGSDLEVLERKSQKKVAMGACVCQKSQKVSRQISDITSSTDTKKNLFDTLIITSPLFLRLFFWSSANLCKLKLGMQNLRPKFSCQIFVICRNSRKICWKKFAAPLVAPTSWQLCFLADCVSDHVPEDEAGQRHPAKRRHRRAGEHHIQIIAILQGKKKRSQEDQRQGCHLAYLE